jgi:hypothetical protein
MVLWTKMRATTSSVVALLGVLAASPARADRIAECASASERGQRERDEGHLRAARDAFVSCAKDVCPVIIQRDCTEFAVDVERRLPTALLVARDDRGTDLVDVAVSMDGARLVDRIGPAGVPIDPGLHTFRFDDRGRSVSVRVLLREGEKNRAIVATFASPKDAPPETTRPIPTWSWVLGGVAIAGGAAFAALRLTTVDDAKELDRTCAPSCASERVDALRTRFLVADIGLAIGIAAAVAASVLYVVRPTVASGRGAPARAERSRLRE